MVAAGRCPAEEFAVLVAISSFTDGLMDEMLIGMVTLNRALLWTGPLDIKSADEEMKQCGRLLCGRFFLFW